MCPLHFIILANEAIIKYMWLCYIVTTCTNNLTINIASFFLGYFISVKNVHAWIWHD